MTLKLMSEFGIHWEWNKNKIEIKPQKYVGKDIAIESDWSAATFWFEIAALAEKCNIKLNGLFKESIQGDKNVVKLFEKLGVAAVFKNNQLILTKNGENSLPKEIDLLETPDMYQPLICTLSALNLNREITGLQTLKDKETNRIIAVENELEKLKSSKEIETYKDHRMAMSFAPLCLKFGKLQINNSEVVNKSYPNFWRDLKIGGFTIVPSTD
jgi:3-phosphoshikimate 1-carboxyvinyltransferase